MSSGCGKKIPSILLFAENASNHHLFATDSNLQFDSNLQLSDRIMDTDVLPVGVAAVVLGQGAVLGRTGDS